VHELATGHHSLGAIQQGLSSWVRLGVVTGQNAGRARLYSVAESHGAVPALRALVDPWRMLQEVINETINPLVSAVILFGSYASGTATEDSDIDLAVIADGRWDGRFELQDKVRASTGNACDVLVFTLDQFTTLARNGEPVVADILRVGIALAGAMPQITMEHKT
jgi:predicted nucleotidyltransferase